MAPSSDRDAPAGESSQFHSENEVVDEYNRAAIIKQAVENAPSAPLFSFNSFYRARLAIYLARITAGLDRSLTPEEAEHFVQHESKRLHTRSYGVPLVLAAALFFERRGRHQFRLPIRTIHDPNVFGHGFLPLRLQLYGPKAVRAWHTTRFAAYWLVSWFSLGLMTHSLADVTAARSQMADKVVRDAMHELLSKRSPNMQKKLQEFQARQHPGQGPPHPARRPFSQPHPGQAPPQEEDQSWGSQSYSVTEPEPYSPSPEQQSPPTPTSQTGASAWDRLRQSAANKGVSPGQDAQPRRPQTWEERRRAAQQGGQAGDSYSYSSSDEEKALPKDQAQKEFDAMLERERRGGGSN